MIVESLSRYFDYTGVEFIGRDLEESERTEIENSFTIMSPHSSRIGKKNQHSTAPIRIKPCRPRCRLRKLMMLAWND